MPEVVIDRDSTYAPCCYLICLVREDGTWNTRREEDTVLVQSDFEWPSLASDLGWTPCEACGDTDGTVDCAHRSASEMIEEAGEYLDDHLGERFEDPGYF